MVDLTQNREVERSQEKKPRQHFIRKKNIKRCLLPAQFLRSCHHPCLLCESDIWTMAGERDKGGRESLVLGSQAGIHDLPNVLSPESGEGV